MPANISLTENSFLTDDDFINTLILRINTNLGCYKNLLATLDNYIEKHMTVDEARTFAKLFSEETYSKKVVKSARIAYLRNKQLVSNPLFILAGDLSDFLTTVANTTDPMIVDFARQAILLTHDMFNHQRVYGPRCVESLSATLVAATAFSKNTDSQEKLTDFTNKVTDFAIAFDERSKLQKMMSNHLTASTFIAAALMVVSCAAIAVLPWVAPLVIGSVALTTILFTAFFTIATLSVVTGVGGLTLVSDTANRLRDPALAHKDQLVDYTLASFRSFARAGFFKVQEKICWEKPLLSPPESSNSPALA